MKIKNNYKNINNCVLIDSWIPWPIVSIFSGIHWDEISWIKANKNFYDKVKSWEINLKKWKLILVLEANEQAIKINDRQVKYNLNRLFKSKLEDIDDYEYKRAWELKSILNESDYLLDLHSTSGPSIPFIFSEIQNLDFAKQLGVSQIIAWWNELGWIISGDTETYINSKSWVWFTFEAWNHTNPNWEKNAYQMILNFLSYLWFIDKNYFKIIGGNKKEYIKMKSAYIAKTNNFKYLIHDIENFKKIEKWTIIWKDNKNEVIAENNMVFIMPKKEDIIKKWEEIFFIWEEI